MNNYFGVDGNSVVENAGLDPFQNLEPKASVKRKRQNAITTILFFLNGKNLATYFWQLLF